ncbi:unnamed protein product [Paramecium octaurelia]|uniref:Uncharacterized protein n=1 Tax=Paramecium octaurelia TaxID=43137 RepID=A0A8S1X5T9_PAROT|nr:unnamed protein product [Paramecium octaurelia]
MNSATYISLMINNSQQWASQQYVLENRSWNTIITQVKKHMIEYQQIQRECLIQQRNVKNQA